MWEALQRYKALDRESQQLFRRAAVLLPWLSVSLRVRGYNRTLAALQRKLGVRNPIADADVTGYPDKVCRMVRAAVHYGVGSPSCLEQSLTLWYLLQRRGIPVQLRIGVKKEAEKFEAHAWVEQDGVALNQAEEMHRHYAAFEKEIADVPVERS